MNKYIEKFVNTFSLIFTVILATPFTLISKFCNGIVNIIMPSEIKERAELIIDKIITYVWVVIILIIILGSGGD